MCKYKYSFLLQPLLFWNRLRALVLSLLCGKFKSLLDVPQEGVSYGRLRSMYNGRGLYYKLSFCGAETQNCECYVKYSF